MIVLQISIFLVQVGVSLLAFHPFHISVCEINHVQATNSLEITHKLFWDDFELELVAKYGREMENIDGDHLKELVAQYFEENFRIWIDGQSMQPVFLGLEVENEAAWCFLEIVPTKDFKSLRLRNTILTGLFGDQENIVHVTSMGKVRSIKLNRQLPEGVITFVD